MIFVMKLRLILVSKDGERKEWEGGETEQVRTLKSRLKMTLFSDEEVDHLRLLYAGRELEDSRCLNDALQGAKEPIALHVVAVKLNSKSLASSKSSLCNNLCIIQ